MPLYPVKMVALLLKNSLHHTGADTKFPADLEDTVAAGLQFQNSRLHRGINATPAELGAVRAGLSERESELSRPCW
jgi:hypothetical protein